MALANSGQPRCCGWHIPMGVDTSWNKLPCPYQACTPTEQYRQKTELAFQRKVSQRHGEL